MKTNSEPETPVGSNNDGPNLEPSADGADFAERVRLNQAKLSAELKPRYDFIVCGSGSSGSVVARRLAENAGVSVLLLEAGGDDEVPTVMDACQWPLNLETERQWNFRAQPNPRLNGRAMPLNMERVLGGGSSVNAMIWARGHKNDWDFFAGEVGDDAWNYDSVLPTYRRIEDWHGAPDLQRRGTGGLVFVQPAPDPNPIASAMVAGVGSLGIQVFDDAMSCMMEGDGGAALNNLRIRDGRRLSVFRTYVYPVMDRPNLTVLSSARVLRVVIENKRAKALVKAVEFCREIGNSPALRPYTKREVMPGPLKGAELENFIRNGIATVWHQTCAAKMGRDRMSVVDHEFKVHGIEKLRIADGSIMPRVTTGNTMAPCVIIGERAAEALRQSRRSRHLSPACELNDPNRSEPTQIPRWVRNRNSAKRRWIGMIDFFGIFRISNRKAWEEFDEKDDSENEGGRRQGPVPRCGNRRSWFCGLIHASSPTQTRLFGQNLRGWRRCGRYLVLEPLPRRALRRRKSGVLIFLLRRAAAGVAVDGTLRFPTRDPSVSQPRSRSLRSPAGHPIGDLRHLCDFR
jgi:hypothetical protein